MNIAEFLLKLISFCWGCFKCARGCWIFIEMVLAICQGPLLVARGRGMERGEREYTFDMFNKIWITFSKADIFLAKTVGVCQFF